MFKKANTETDVLAEKEFKEIDSKLEPDAANDEIKNPETNAKSP